MHDKIKMLLASLAVAALGVFGLASPAQAQIINGCNDANSATGYGMVCFFDGTEYGKYRWAQYDLGVALTEPGSCTTFPHAFKNVVSSYVYNPTAPGMVTLTGAYLRFYPNDNCVGTPVPVFPGWNEHSDYDLRTTDWGNVSNVMNSFKLIYG